MPDRSPENSRVAAFVRAIAGDIHFWIPLAVLFAGVTLLHALR